MTLGYNNPEINTPNLDRLARAGVIFDRAYCPNPTCTPTRSSILTGMYPSQHGAYSLGTKLHESVPTVNDVWREHGYKTALVGKAHFQPLRSTEAYPSLESYPILQDLAFWKDFNGPFYGFDDFKLARNHADEAHVGQHYALWLEEKGITNWRDYFQRKTGNAEPQYGAWNIPEEYHYNAWISECTNELMENYVENGAPFFLWSSYFDPHPPYLVPEPWASMYDPDRLTLPEGLEGEHENNPLFHKLSQLNNPELKALGLATDTYLHGVHSHLHSEQAKRQDMAIYYGMVSCMDHYIGKTLDKIEELGIADNTLITFTSDHGHYFGQHNLTAKGPFHYEDGVKVPLIISWPGQTPQGVRSDALQSLVDLPVSFLAAAGLDRPNCMTGVDQLDVWLGNHDEARDHCIVENNHEPGVCELKTYIEANYKITVYRNFSEGELFDLKNDPGEFQNRFNDPAYADIKARLLQRFLQAEMAKEVLPMPRVSGA